MVEYFILDKVYDSGVDYPNEADKFIVIRSIGTDIADKVTIKVDGKPCGDIHSELAPIAMTETNLLGPINLEDVYVVVPPDKILRFDSATTGKIRCIGQLGWLGVGETLPPDLLARFGAQGDHFLTYAEASKSLGTDEAWAYKREVVVATFKPETKEEYLLDRFFLASITGDTVGWGDFGIRFYVKAKPYDWLSWDMGRLGNDVLSMPKPPKATVQEVPFSLAEKPILLPGDIEFKVTAFNTSGASKAPATGAAWTIAIRFPYEFKRLK